MAKRFNILSFAAVLVLLASCAKAGLDGGFATASFSVGLPQTKAVESVSEINTLYAVIYDSEGTEFQKLTLEGSGGHFDSFSVPVVVNETYSIALWAQSSSSGLFSVPDGDVRRITATYGNVSVNNYTDAAFTYSGTFSVSSDKALSLTLKRAVSLVKIMSTTNPGTNLPAMPEFNVSVTFEGGVAAGYDALTGETVPAEGETDFAAGAATMETETSQGTDVYEMAYVYVLPSGANATRIGAMVLDANYGVAGKFEAFDVPLQPNRRTVLSGDMFGN